MNDTCSMVQKRDQKTGNLTTQEICGSSGASYHLALKNVSTQMLMEKNKTEATNKTASSDKPAQPVKSPEEIAEAKSRLA